MYNKITVNGFIVRQHGVQRHFQQYFVAVSFIGGVPGKNHQPSPSH